jgi:ribose 5-phosphate isomerase B
MKIVISSDHAGFELKKFLIASLKDKEPEIEVVDMGPTEYVSNDDYPDYIKKVGAYISEHDDPNECRGIVIGGSGQGENICVNKFKKVRSVLIYCNDMVTNTNMAKASVQHNNANVIAFGARFIEQVNAFDVLHTWLEERFTGEERHVRRLAKLE